MISSFSPLRSWDTGGSLRRAAAIGAGSVLPSVNTRGPYPLFFCMRACTAHRRRPRCARPCPARPSSLPSRRRR
eukprot:365019-Chlamydomonas_euryale.AAC.7